MRSKESLVDSLEQFLLLVSKANVEKKRPPANVNGVNSNGLWSIDPQRILIPVLHCPMGLVDKVWESFKHWVNLYIEDFHDETTEDIRMQYKAAIEAHKAAIDAHKQSLTAFANVAPVFPGAANDARKAAELATKAAKKAVKAADDARKAAKKAEQVAKLEYDEQMKKHNAKKASLNQQFETVFRANGIKREHYHGGKFNGINCIRIMETAKKLILGSEGSQGFLQKCLASKHEMITEEDLRKVCEDYGRLLGLLDAVWSKVRESMQACYRLRHKSLV
jgi:hypothetical protein